MGGARRAGDGPGRGPGLVVGEIPHGAAVEVGLDSPDDIPCGDEVHAAREIAGGDVEAQLIRAIAFVAIAEWADAGAPAAALGAGELSHGVDELVGGVGLPVRGFAASGDDDAGTVVAAGILAGDGGGEVHEAGHAAERALGVVHQPDQLPQIGLSTQINDPVERRVVVLQFTHLDELDAVAEVVDHLLMAIFRPPFDGDVAFSAGGDDPERGVLAGSFVDLRIPGALQFREVEIAVEGGGRDAQSELVVEILGVRLQVVAGRLVAALDQGGTAMDHLHPPSPFFERGQVRVVVPNLCGGGADVGEEPTGIGQVQIPDGGGQHHDVARRVSVFEDQFAWGGSTRGHRRLAGGRDGGWGGARTNGLGTGSVGTFPWGVRTFAWAVRTFPGAVGALARGIRLAALADDRSCAWGDDAAGRNVAGAVGPDDGEDLTGAEGDEDGAGAEARGNGGVRFHSVNQRGWGVGSLLVRVGEEKGVFGEFRGVRVRVGLEGSGDGAWIWWCGPRQDPHP